MKQETLSLLERLGRVRRNRTCVCVAKTKGSNFKWCEREAITIDAIDFKLFRRCFVEKERKEKNLESQIVNTFNYLAKQVSFASGWVFKWTCHLTIRLRAHSEFQSRNLPYEGAVPDRL